MAILTTRIDTPIGEMIAGATDSGICLLDFRYRKLLPAIRKRIAEGLNDEFAEGSHALLDDVRRELHEYFAGTRKEFSVPLLPIGSAFQQRIWQGLEKI